MIQKIDIIAAARAVIRRNEGYTLPTLIHPRRDWWIGINAFAVVVIGGSLILAQMYVVFQSVDQLVGAEANQIPRYQAEVVQDVNTLYENRRATYDVLVAAAVRVVVPEPVGDELTATSTEAVAVETDDVVAEEVALPILGDAI